MNVRPVRDKLSPALWRLLALMLSAVINYVDRGSLSTAAPLLKVELGDESVAAWHSVLLVLFCVCGVHDRCGLAGGPPGRQLGACGFLLRLVRGNGCERICISFAALFLARVVLGMGESVSFPCCATLLARHVSDQQRGMANAVVATGMAIGPAVCKFTGGVLMAKLGWLPAWLKWMPRGSPTAISHRNLCSPGIFQLLKQRSAVSTCLADSSQCYGWYLLLTWAPYYLVRARQFSMIDMAKITGGAYLCFAISSTLCGRLSDRWIEAGGSQTLVRKTITFVGQTGAGIFLLLCPLVGRTASPVCLLLGFACAGSFCGQTWAMMQTQAGPRALGKWLAIANSFGSVAGILAPSVTGFLVNRTGSFAWPLALAAFITVCGAICWVFAVGPVKEINCDEKVSVPNQTAVVA